MCTNFKILNKTVSILGCGWLGKPLAQRLVQSGYKIKGSTRSNNKVDQLALLGIETFVVDIGNFSSSIQTFLNSGTLIINITSKDIVHYQNLLDQIIASPIKKVLFVSSTSVYRPENEVITEETIIDLGFSPLAKIEGLFRGNKEFKTTIVRFGGLFGYDRKPGKFFHYGKVVDPEARVNMIHRDDCISIIEQIIQQELWGETFNCCADDHPTKRMFYTKAANDIGVEPPVFSEQGESVYKIISNKKVRGYLNFEFNHNDLLNLKDEI